MKLKLKKGMAAGAVLLLISVLMTGCFGGGADKDAVAVVDGTAIKLDQLEKNFLLVEKNYKEIYGDTIMTEQMEGKSVREILRLEILNNLVDEVLVIKELENQGYKPDAAEIDKRQKEFTEKELDQKPENKKFYEEKGIDKDFIRNSIRAQMYLAEFQKRINDQVMLESTGLEEEFKQYVVEVQARHILLPDTEEAKAKELLAKVKEGADFATLAKENSIDPGTAAKGGDLGFFKRGVMVPEFGSVAFSLKPGEVSDVVKTQFGYHIIKVEARKTIQDLMDEGATEDQLKQEKDTMVRNLIQERYEARMSELRKNAKIEKFEDRLK